MWYHSWGQVSTCAVRYLSCAVTTRWGRPPSPDALADTQPTGPARRSTQPLRATSSDPEPRPQTTDSRCSASTKTPGRDPARPPGPSSRTDSRSPRMTRSWISPCQPPRERVATSTCRGAVTGTSAVSAAISSMSIGFLGQGGESVKQQGAEPPYPLSVEDPSAGGRSHPRCSHRTAPGPGSSSTTRLSA